MEAGQSLIACQIRDGFRARLGDIDKVDVLPSKESPIMVNLHPTERAGAIVVDGESGIDHAVNVGLGHAAAYVAEERSAFSRLGGGLMTLAFGSVKVTQVGA